MAAMRRKPVVNLRCVVVAWFIEASVGCSVAEAKWTVMLPWLIASPLASPQVTVHPKPVSEKTGWPDVPAHPTPAGSLQSAPLP